MGRKARLEVILDCSDPEELMGFWREALGYRVYYSEPSLAVLVPHEVNASPLLLQQVPEPKVGKNRMHVDIVTDDVDITACSCANPDDRNDLVGAEIAVFDPYTGRWPRWPNTSVYEVAATKVREPMPLTAARRSRASSRSRR